MENENISERLMTAGITSGVIVAKPAFVYWKSNSECMYL